MYSISFQEDSLLPRERLAKEGVEALSNQELLAILLRTGTRQASVFEIAQKVLNNLSSLTDLKKMTLQELQSLSPQLFTPNLKTIQNPCLSLDPGWFLFS
ncbi:hypothetical protein OLC24_08415, partial [Streptococcus pneumoniae]|nr:hypothetical protein [Streptococcus pneumoniae]MDG8657427.1 hypothetical protein [Streptococcus pneumoniae]